MHFVSDLLNRQGSVLKQYFNFHYYDLIDQLLGRLMRRPAHDGGKITGRDTEPVSYTHLHLGTVGENDFIRNCKFVERLDYQNGILFRIMLCDKRAGLTGQFLWRYGLSLIHISSACKRRIRSILSGGRLFRAVRFFGTGSRVAETPKSAYLWSHLIKRRL